MTRLENIVKSDKLKGMRVVITGCGYKPVEKTFYDVTTNKPTHDSIYVDGKEMKLNIGSAVAVVLASNGATVNMVARSEDKLKNIKEEFGKIVDKNLIEYSKLDLLSEAEIKNFVLAMPKDKPIYWVQSMGLGAGAYKLKDDNPYLHIEDIPSELIEMEALTVLKGTHNLMRYLLPVFREQNKKFDDETRVAIISSMSAVRGYSHGGAHCAAKGAISRYTNSAMLDLWKEKIYVTDIRPGAIDTGMYDNENVQKAILEIDKDYGNYWNKSGIRLAPPVSVGEAINFVFTTPAHVPSLNLVARGQFPNEGS